MDETKTPMQLSVSVLKRALSEDELNSLLGLYKKTPRKMGSYDKEVSLNKPLTDSEHAFLFDYLNTKASLRELSEKHEYKNTSTAQCKLNGIAKRYLYQNRESLK